jgi:hypothetical protein
MDSEYAPSPVLSDNTAGPRPEWRDLREWLALLERHGELKRISAEVDPIEELAAITLASRWQEYGFTGAAPADSIFHGEK